MAKSRTHRMNQTVMLLIVCAVSAMLGFSLRPNKIAIAKAYPSLLLRQSDEKAIEKSEFPNEPFQLSNLSVKNVKISPGRKFSIRSLAEKGGGQVEDWLENLNFTIKNTSDKPITYIDIELDFPDTQVNGPMMVYNRLGFGIPPYVHGNNLKNYTPLTLAPDNTITFALSAQQLQLLKDFLAFRDFQLANLNKAVIRISYVIFDDATKWELGRIYKPNPNMPGGYERISPIDQ